MSKHSLMALLAALLCLAAVANAADGSGSLLEKCAAEFQKVTTCLPFATQKAAAPSKECCTAVTDLRGSDPACLCYIIQQVHNGTNPAVKSMGVQESRLLQLPSACHLVNASISECPRLLHLPPNSPDAAIFTNASTTATNTTVSPPGTSSQSTANYAFRHKPHIFELISVSIISAFVVSSQYGLPTLGILT